MLRRILPYLFIALSLCLLRTESHACPYDTYLGIGQAVYPNTTNFSASFPNSYGTATCNGPFELDQDAQFQTCTPSTWNAQSAGYYGTVSYNDGEVSYSGAARFWFDLVPAETPNCVYQSVARAYMVRRLKIQSCTSGHVLTSRFIAVSCDGSYCEDWQGVTCENSGGYMHFNSLNMTVSGF